jgi:multicomponent Na+:H+ antiporter subunit B
LAGFGVAGAVLAGFFVASALQMRSFGSHHHPYRDWAIAAAVRQQTANVVSSLTFDQRGLDTLFEETIMLASVLGAAALLRPARGEEERRIPDVGWILSTTRLAGYVMLPLSVLIGIDLIAHGALTPGGGFQGGVVLATGVHLLYVAGSFRAVDRIRPLSIHEMVEAIAAGGFVVVGLAGAIASGTFLTNFIGKGTFAELRSAGTVPILNGLVGAEVAAAVVVLLAHFLDQEILVQAGRDARNDADGRGEQEVAGR